MAAIMHSVFATRVREPDFSSRSIPRADQIAQGAKGEHREEFTNLAVEDRPQRTQRSKVDQRFLVARETGYRDTRYRNRYTPFDITSILFKVRHIPRVGIFKWILVSFLRSRSAINPFKADLGRSLCFK